MHKVKTSLFKIILCLLASTKGPILCNSAFAYGNIGHRIVAQVAWENLSAETRRKVTALMDGQHIGHLPNWADSIKSDKKNWGWSFPHHYVNLPHGATSYDAKKRSPKGDIFWALKHHYTVLKSKDPKRRKDRVVRQQALKFLLHFVGDLHQPLHIGYKEDHGANKVKIKWFGKPTNLHRLWDEQLVEFDKYSFTEFSHFLRPLVAKLKKEQAPFNLTHSFIKWGLEGRQYYDRIYPEGTQLPGIVDKVSKSSKGKSGKSKGRGKRHKHNLGYEYQYKVKDIVYERLALAGLRLAMVLESLREDL